MDTMETVFPVRVLRFANSESGDTEVETTVLAECTGVEDGVVEFAFNLGKKRYYIGLRVEDVARLGPLK